MAALDAFVDRFTDDCVDVDGWFGCQCMDLSIRWASFLGLGTWHAGAAVGMWDEAPEGWQRIANGPDNAPEPGDVVVWGYALGEHGHTAICLTANGGSFRSLDQNYPAGSERGSPAAVISHGYHGVLGWFHPTTLEPVPPKPASKPADVAEPLDGHFHMGAAA